MNIEKILATASLAIFLALSCLQAQVQKPQLIHEIDVDPNQLPPPLSKHCPPHRVLSISWDKDNRLMAVGIGSGGGGCSFSGAVQFFDMTAQGEPRLMKTLHLTDWAGSVAFNPKRTELAIGGHDKKVYIINGTSPFNVLKILPEATDRIQSVTFNPNGTQLAAGGYDTEVRLYNVTNRFRLMKVLSESRGRITDIDYHPSLAELAVSSEDHRLRKYSGIPPFTLKQELNDLNTELQAVAYNPDGTQLTIGGNSTFVMIYDLLQQHFYSYSFSVPDSVTSISYNKSGIEMAIGFLNGEIMVYKKEEDIPTPINIYSLYGGSTRTIYSPDGKLLATWGSDDKIMMYQIVSRTVTGAVTKTVTEAVTTTVTEAGSEVSTESGTEVKNASTLVALTFAASLTAALEGIIFQ
ncbi:WD40 repeat domain-containing protein [Endozoicomonas sp. ISHI1]|uniref:WD40 repeat domain-containing protein n=1 Tax=Endozoicomonas sp. ISHI1 TaxID=2825882 RepID=UPI0021495A7C|nr:hypothetical protein [Endozoicomonas sp. ISHI1]